MSDQPRRSLRRATLAASSSTPSTPPPIARESCLLEMEEAMKVANLGSKRQSSKQKKLLLHSLKRTLILKTEDLEDFLKTDLEDFLKTDPEDFLKTADLDH
jgi:hypothetical protein